MSIHRAYQSALERLRSDPNFALPIPTLLEVAAQYRRLVPDALMADVRAEVARAQLRLADIDDAPQLHQRALVA